MPPEAPPAAAAPEAPATPAAAPAPSPAPEQPAAPVSVTPEPVVLPEDVPNAPTPEPGSPAAQRQAAAATPEGAEPAAPAEEGAEVDLTAFESLALPDGSDVDGRVLDEVKAFAAANGLTLEQAEADLGRQVAHTEAVTEAYDAEVDGWRDELQADLGEGFAEADRLTTAFITKHGGVDLLNTLKDSGFAYYRPLFDLVHNAAKATSEPQTQVQAPPAAPGPLTEEQQYALAFKNSPPMPGPK